MLYVQIRTLVELWVQMKDAAATVSEMVRALEEQNCDQMANMILRECTLPSPQADRGTTEVQVRDKVRLYI